LIKTKQQSPDTPFRGAGGYSQLKAMLAITKASLSAVFRSPSAVIFSLVFPLIFILVFGFIGGGGRINLRVAFAPNTDTTTQLYKILKNATGISIVNKPLEQLNSDLEKGRIAAILSITKNISDTPQYKVNLTSSEAVNPQNLQVLKIILESMIQRLENYQPVYASINPDIKKVPGRVYRTIDFILPGQLGFSLLGAGVFGVAFIFFNLRQTLVLKRFFATPIKRPFIVFGEAISRVIFQMITAVVILAVGYFAFKFTLVHGWVTFLELLVLSFVGLIVFMGFGFVVSGLSKNESAIPPFANLITMPQFILGGTFFSTEIFPDWLRPIANILPLTHLNDAMRNVAFEGAHLVDCGKQLGILGIWIVVVYAIAIKVFRWE